ncbi:MGDG synthase family glycosyltransferase [Bacillus sp. T33-2]|uniref:MGDG synthase family glycosyltransferase n=1 Tax=Bacillus sp. T33-2 TaxID=2054168 RepID=UPI000C76B8E0|nr:glycosyltransferase [Bacillus sp. T33-2]PLR92849.1 diacylglycerol glucosyltransferase [Bacillus sp. T33-2]
MRRPSALILTARYGSGHIQAAKVIASELQNQGFQPVISDLFGESYPAISKFTQSLLIKSFNNGPYFYKWFYYGTNKINSKGLAQFSCFLGRKRLMQLIAGHRPQFVISTFPLHSAPFLINKYNESIPVYTVITDYCVHPYWINPLIDHYFVSCDSVKSGLLKQNVSEKQVTVSGIPIRADFEKRMDTGAVFQKHELSPYKKVVTILAGAQGVLKNVKELCLALLQNPSVQVIAVCGKNRNLYEKLLPLIYVFPGTFRLFAYTEDIQELFAISHCLVTKPGGITVTEAASLKLPLILYKPVPGQEAENARHFAEKGAALVSHTLVDTIDHVQRVSRNEELANSMKWALQQIHKAHSAKTITDYAIQQTHMASDIPG